MISTFDASPGMALKAGKPYRIGSLWQAHEMRHGKKYWDMF